MKFRKIIETSIYSSDLEKMKEFYVDKLGLELVSEQKGRPVFTTNYSCYYIRRTLKLLWGCVTATG